MRFLLQICRCYVSHQKTKHPKCCFVARKVATRRFKSCFFLQISPKRSCGAILHDLTKTSLGLWEAAKPSLVLQKNLRVAFGSNTCLHTCIYTRVYRHAYAHVCTLRREVSTHVFVHRFEPMSIHVRAHMPIQMPVHMSPHMRTPRPIRVRLAGLFLATSRRMPMANAEGLGPAEG